MRGGALTLLAMLAGCSADVPPTANRGDGVAATPVAAAPSPAAEPSADAGSPEQVARLFLTRAAARDIAGALAVWDGEPGAGNAAIAGFAGQDAASIHVDAATDADAGAGQRYITVPFRIGPTGGTLVLHRAAEGIPSDNPHAHDWRVRSIALAPALPDGMPATDSATYDCGDGVRPVVRFDNRTATAVIERDGRAVTLIQQPAGSGIHYAGNGYDLRGKGRDARITIPDGDTKDCVAD